VLATSRRLAAICHHQGAKILKAHLQDILDIIGEALDASVARDRDRVRAAVRDMKALFNQLAEEAGPYAQRAGAGRRIVQAVLRRLAES